MAPLLLTGGPAGAAPLDFAPGSKLTVIECTGVKLAGLVAMPGDGPFTPYLASNGQLLVPTSFTLTSDSEGLKSRHLVGDSVTKPGRPGSTTCYVSGLALDEKGDPVDFTATIVGNLVGPVTAG